MNKNTAIFLIGSIGLILGWNWVMSRYYPVTTHPMAQTEAAASRASEAAGPAAAGNSSPASSAFKAGQASLKPAPEQLVSVSTTAYEVSLSTWGARFNHLKLRG